MEQQKKTPAVRFRGFDEEWGIFRIEETCDIHSGGTPSTSNEEYWNGNINWFTPSEINKNYVSKSLRKISTLGLNNSSATLLKKGTILFTTRATIGEVAIALEACATNQGFQSIEVNDMYDKLFIFNWLKNNKEEFVKKSSGSTFLEISKDKIKKIPIYTPTKPEQTKIGSFFENLDELLNKHQTQHQKLNALKKAMLGKLFPKQGATVPEIRFKGFTGDWEVEKLGGIGKCSSGTSIESEFTSKGRYKVISIGSYSENSKYTDQGIRTVLNDKIEKRILNKGDLTMVLNDKTASGRILGRVLLISENDKFVYNQRTQRIEPKEEFDSNFLYHYLNAPLIRKKVFDMAQGNTQIYVNWSAISELEYLIPKKEEQQQIGNYFKNLDELITNHATQIEKLGNLKKACLSKMFV